MDWTKDRPLLLVSALCPWLVIGLCFWLLSAEADGSDWQPSEEGARLTQRVRDEAPQVVVLGNSVTHTHIEPERVAAAVERERITRVSHKASNAITWWLMLKNHVYGAGVSPDLVIVPFEVDFLLAQQLSTAERMRAAPYWGPVELELENKLLGGDGPRWWQRLQQRRGEHRDWFLEATRDLLIGQLFIEDEDAATGHDLAEHALEEVFSFENMRGAGERGPSAIPVVDVREELAARRVSLLDRTVEASLLPELLALTQAHGSRVLFVQIPLPTSNDRSAYDRALRAQLVEHLNQADHASFLDLSTLPVSAADFSDNIHLNAQGRRRFTDALVAALAELDIFGTGPLPQAEVEAIARVSRLGSPPAMPELEYAREGGCEQRLKLPEDLRQLGSRLMWRQGVKAVSPLEVLQDAEPLLAISRGADACTGSYAHQSSTLDVNAREPFTEGPRLQLTLSDQAPLVQDGAEAWWVYPGTSLLLEFDKPWPHDQLRVALGLFEAVPGDRPPRFEVDGQQVRIKGDGFLTASHRGSASGGPLRLEVSSPTGGPWLLITELEVAYQDTTWRPVSTDRTLLSEARLLDVAALDYQAATPRIQSRLEEQDLGWQRRVLPANYRSLSDSHLRDEYNYQRCSPLRVYEDDVVVQPANSSCKEVKLQAAGSCTKDDSIVYGSSDGSDPNTNERRYRVSADPDHSCGKQGRWLYPGELMRLRLRGKNTRHMPPGGETLEVSALPFKPVPAKGKVRVEVRVDGRKVYTQRYKAKALLEGVEVRIPALTRLKGDLSVTLKSDDDAPWLLVTSVSVRR